MYIHGITQNLFDNAPDFPPFSTLEDAESTVSILRADLMDAGREDDLSALAELDEMGAQTLMDELNYLCAEYILTAAQLGGTELPEQIDAVSLSRNLDKMRLWYGEYIANA